MSKFSLTPQKACKEAPKPKCDDDDDKKSRPVTWDHKKASTAADKKKSGCGCD